MQDTDQTPDAPTVLQSGFASNSFAKGLAVFDAFDSDSVALSMAEIARRTGQDRATARRGVLTLEAMGFLQRKGRLFALSPKVLILAGKFLRSTNLFNDAMPVLGHYARQVGTDLFLTTLVDQQVLVLCHTRSLPRHEVESVEIGTTTAPYNCATGRVLLAALPDAELHALLDQVEIQRKTPRSLTDPSAILDRVKMARAFGHAIEFGEFNEGFAGYAVPVGTAGTRLFSLGLRHPLQNAPHEPIEDSIKTLQACAEELARLPALSSF